ncbi:hypothetical protein [Streptomyces silvisoli]|uniref:Lasso RiPP family leader peptide-containing protein n=1 Tax=Streptomyces silvisoli TaxID=3034235 RepID=A0ABT5ZWD9_9ACTN|nr:hypothetical protein [Streptomyces silvisoli]MDF3294140.1 hypothetical protein [Streptomyces silvisoli]
MRYFNLDAGRPNKSVAFIVDLGRYVKPVITPTSRNASSKSSSLTESRSPRTVMKAKPIAHAVPRVTRYDSPASLLELGGGEFGPFWVAVRIDPLMA